MDSQPIRVGIYVRLSQDREGQTSTARQEQDCRKLAEDRGWTVHRTYSDLDLSGYTGVERPAFSEMLADLEAGKLDGVIAWKLDRLSRNRRDWNRLAELVDAGASLACVNDPVDTSTPLGSVVVDLLASMARAESANTSTRVRSAMEARARAGKPHTAGGRVFGYTEDYQLVPKEAAAARSAAEQLLAGASLRSVAASMNARGITTADGNEWAGVTLGRTLSAPTLAAIRTHKGTEYPGNWPAVLDRPTWERLRALLSQRAARYRTGGARLYLLSSLAVCGLCGTGMNGQRKPDGTARYRCVRNLGGCGRVGALASGLDGFVRDAVLVALDGPGLSDALRRQGSETTTATTVADLDAAEARLEQLAADHYADAILSRAEYLAAREAVEGRINELRAHLEADASTATLSELIGVDLAEWWDDPANTNERRRAVLDVVLDGVEVGPVLRGGRGFDTDRITLRWRV